MRFALILAAGLLFPHLLRAQGYPNIAPTDPKTPAEELKTFKLPPGFEAQLVASEPDIRKPIQIAFDAKGRLWATTSEEYPFAAVGRPGKDRLYVMEDFGADGKAKKVSIFADDLNIPIGVLPLPDCKSAIVSSIDPGDGKGKLQCWIWKLTDTDGDGKADKKEKLYGPFGCDDTHGMNNSYTLMPDGWVYACHGFKNESRPKGKDGHEIVMNSGNTFRFRPDGSRIEIWTRGQVNPFGIAVDPYFNLYTADCHSKPITQLIHGATYQSFGKPHDGLGFAPHVTIHGHESTALCGLVYYAADHFPKEYLDHMFLGNVTSNCINLDKIEFVGATPKAIDKGQFLRSSDLWFRPTDIELGPDGALYFADFYNRIIGHYEVDLKHPARDKLRGRVWRIIYRGMDGKGDAPKMPGDLTSMSAKHISDLTNHPNLTVRIQVINEMIRRGKEFVTELGTRFLNPESVNEEIADLWLVTSHRENRPPTLKRELRINADKSAMTLLHVHRTKAYAQIPYPSDLLTFRAKAALGSNDPVMMRAGAETLVDSPAPESLAPLLIALGTQSNEDTILNHAIKVALRESAAPLKDWDKAAGKTEWTAADIKALSGIAIAVPAAAAAKFLTNHLQALSADSARLPINIEHAARYATDPKDVLKFIQSHKPDDVKLTILMLNAYQQGLQKRGSADKEAVALAEKLCSDAINSNDSAACQAGIDLASSLKLAVAYDSLAKLVQTKGRNEAQRTTALTALSTIDSAKSVPLLVKLLNDSAEAIVVREKAAQALAGANRDDGNEELIKAFQTAPARLQTAMAVAMANSNKGAEALLKAIESGKASARLLQDRLVQTRLNDRKLPKTAERIAALTKSLPSPDEKMFKLIVDRRGAFTKAKPDVVLGKQIFVKNCAICHQIRNEGTKIGPQLDGIGGRGLDRLLEDILDPNRNVDAAFRSTRATLTDGKNVSGLVLREEGQILVMADDKGKEIRIAKNDIEERRTSLLSPMPANVVELIPEKDFYDLLAYLLSQRAKDK